MNNQLLKKEIMMRVRAVHVTRKVLKPLVIEAGLFVILFVVINFLISVPNVVANLSMVRAGEVGGYLLVSFLKTGAIVKLTLVLAAFIFGFLVRDIVRDIKDVSFTQTA